MRRIIFLRIVAVALAATCSIAPFTTRASLGDHTKFVAYSKIAHRAWITLYKMETFGNRKIIAFGWMPARGDWTHDIVYGNTYYVRAEVVDGAGNRLYDTTAKWDEQSPTSITLWQGTGNYYWK